MPQQSPSHRPNPWIQAIFLTLIVGLVVLLAIRWWYGSPLKGMFRWSGELVVDTRDTQADTQPKPADSLGLPVDKDKKVAMQVETFYDGIARFEQGGKYGYIRKDKQVLIPAQFDNADVKFVEGMAWVRKNDKYGYVNQNTGKIEIPPLYDEAGRFYQGFATVRLGSRTGKLNQQGLAYGIDAPAEDILKDPYFRERFEYIGAFRGEGAEARARIRDFEGLWGFMDKQGTVVVPPQYDAADDYNGRTAWVQYQGRCGLIKLDGEPLLPIEYEEIAPRYFAEALVRVRQKGKYGFANQEGRVVAPPIYEQAGYFREGLAAVRKNNKYGFIDEKGTLAIPLRYDEITFYETHYGFYNGKAKMRVGNRQGYVYRDGSEWWFE
ncbi:WG repeat-containing protein [Eisenibacter elegans]|uniref:WG repeat-containing protein n=1 Tax=Eisenibacter elegans TaxID=997 RepID=UPI0003F65ADE|nr:WG repeat-containing protein [Eisenibacter elegans]